MFRIKSIKKVQSFINRMHVKNNVKDVQKMHTTKFLLELLKI
jgi:hypothetical protein